MKNSKLILLLGTFSTAEWRRFGEYLSSPFLNKRTELPIFHKYLKSIAPTFPEKKLDKKLLFKHIYPNDPFDHRHLVHLTNYMLKHAEFFLAHLRLEQEEHTINTLILEELMERNLEKHYRHYINKSTEVLNNKQITNSQYLLQQYQLSDIAKRHFLGHKKRKYDANLQASSDYLDQFYFLNKMKTTCEMLEWSNIIATDVQFTFLDETVAYLEKNKANLSPLILLYLSVYHLYTNENVESIFLHLRALLNKHQHTISDVDKNYLYLFVINFCDLQIKLNNNIQYYANQGLELYLEGIKHKFLYVNGFLSPWTFKNIVKLGLKLEKFDWSTEFIQTYSTHLEKSFQEDALHFNMADLNYRKKDYQQAQFHLMQVRYSDVFYNLGAKIMLIKIYFETDEEEALLSMIASFTIYLKRNNKIASNIKQTYLNFTTLMNKLLRAKLYKIPRIQEEIKTTPLLTDRLWLLKASELSEALLTGKTT